MTVVLRYHDGTKHDFHRFARSLGYLDWASQPRPFRAFEGSRSIPLYPQAVTGPHAGRLPIRYDELFRPTAVPAAPVQIDAIGDVLRHALGLSAWKRLHGSERDAPRWSLRVNPSSGNLHPTEAYLITGPLEGLTSGGGVFHYAPDRHALEQRCAFAPGLAMPAGTVLIALTSIHWREAWKYGERAFRYCQHDLGHAIAAVRIAAGLVGWDAGLLPGWSHRDIAAVTGVERDEDFVEAEREEPGCVIGLQASGFGRQAAGVGLDAGAWLPASGSGFVEAARAGTWTGRASQLSEDHVEWTFIDDVARATEDPARPAISAWPGHATEHSGREEGPADVRPFDARALLLQRRSAVDFDGHSSIGRDRFVRILSRVMPGAHAPWDALWWSPRIHLVLFVHRVEGVEAGLYILIRDPGAGDRLHAALGPELLWERADDTLPLWRLASGDRRATARRLSCDQDIAADGSFSLGMLADFDASLAEFGPSFYRHLFWESGVLGQMLYLEAEAAGARGTGIGCFYDDRVHELVGIGDHSFQSLYHFTVGIPVEDTRLTTEPGYAWEIRDS